MKGLTGQENDAADINQGNRLSRTAAVDDHTRVPLPGVRGTRGDEHPRPEENMRETQLCPHLEQRADQTGAESPESKGIMQSLKLRQYYMAMIAKERCARLGKPQPNAWWWRQGTISAPIFGLKPIPPNQIDTKTDGTWEDRICRISDPPEVRYDEYPSGESPEYYRPTPNAFRPPVASETEDERCCDYESCDCDFTYGDGDGDEKERAANPSEYTFADSPETKLREGVSVTEVFELPDWEWSEGSAPPEGWGVLMEHDEDERLPSKPIAICKTSEVLEIAMAHPLTDYYTYLIFWRAEENDYFLQHNLSRRKAQSPEDPNVARIAVNFTGTTEAIAAHRHVTSIGGMSAQVSDRVPRDSMGIGWDPSEWKKYR